MRLPVRLLALLLPLALLAPAPATARVPDGLQVTGWILEGGGHNLLRKNHGGITTLSIAGTTIWPNGEGVHRATTDAKNMSRRGRAFHLSTELLVSNYSNRTGDFDRAALHRLLASPANREAVVSRLADEAVDFDGINVDLELVRAADGPGLVDLVEKLQAAMPEDKTVSIAISAATSVRAYRQRGYRLAGLAGAADVIDVMTYDLHGTWSGPGPVGALDWQRDALDALLSVVPADQVQLGVAGYGYTWPRQGTGRSVTDRQARGMVERDGATAHWRPGPGEWTARLSDGTILWWSDRRSYDARVALAREYAVRGLAVWRIGSADTLR